MTKKPTPNTFSDIGQEINGPSEFAMLPYWDFDFNQLPWNLLWAGLVKTEGQVQPGHHKHCITQAAGDML